MIDEEILLVNINNQIIELKRYKKRLLKNIEYLDGDVEGLKRMFDKTADLIEKMKKDTK